MCNNQEWESLRRRVRETGVESDLRELVADAMSQVEAIVEDLKRRACAPEDEGWGRRCRRRSRTEWVA